MLDMISKPAGQIGENDIEALIRMEVPEGDQIEFKESLRRRTSSADHWILGENKVGEGARNEILEEVVAFANAHGGALLVGIRESESKPHVASEIKPLPRCVELAERFGLMFRDCVEPQVPVVEVFGVRTKGESGVVIIRVGRSRLAPHRVEPTRNCTVRRADRCEKMTMREIQDMTLNVSRGMERLDKRLADRSERFRQELGRLETPDDSYALRFTALPVGEEISYERVYDRQGIIPELRVPWCAVTRIRGNIRQNLEVRHQFPPVYWRPILRGARADINSSLNRQSYLGYQELHCDGTVEAGFAACNKESRLDPNLALSLFANTANWANHVRNQSSPPILEFAIEVEIRVAGKLLTVRLPDDDVLNAVIFPATAEEAGVRFERLAPRVSNAKFPVYTLNSEVTPVDLLAIFSQDFWNWLGKYVPSNTEEFVIGQWQL